MNAYEQMKAVLEAADSFIVNLEIEPYSHLDEVASELREKINSALALPRRNCDVGTPEEQTERYRKFCFTHRYLGSDLSYTCKGFGKGRCPFFDSHTKSKCEFAWAQTPYEAQEGGAQ